MENITYQQESGRVWIGSRAFLLNDDDRPKAWAEKYVRHDRDIRWLLGNFVEADNPNGNGHIFPLADLKGYGVATIANKPLNMLHHERYIVGAYAGAELVEPAIAAGEIANPYVEALAGMWGKFFPEELAMIENAHKDGTLFFSMEANPESITCPEDGCGHTTVWAGFEDPSYCDHLNASKISKKILNKAHFNAGAIIIPPVRPGWSNADITSLSSVLQAHADQAEALYDSIEHTFDHLSPKAWEHLMGEILLLAHPTT